MIWEHKHHLFCPQLGFNMVGALFYIFTPTGLSSRNWNGTWRLTFLCSTTRWPRRCDAPTTRTVSPFNKTTSPLASSEIIKGWQYIRNMYLWHNRYIAKVEKSTQPWHIICIIWRKFFVCWRIFVTIMWCMYMCG
jgi:hypothetical protein